MAGEGGEKKNPPNTARQSATFLFCSCGCLLIIAVFLLFALCCFSWGIPALNLIHAKPSLPSFVPATKEDREGFEKKMQALASASGQLVELILTPGEANYALGKLSPLPERGFCLEKAWFSPGQGKIRLIMEGSGFFLNSLVIAGEIENFECGNSSLIFRNPQVNSFKPDWAISKRILDYWFQSYVKRVWAQRKNLRELEIEKFVFHPDKVILICCSSLGEKKPEAGNR